jgi:putative endonuclease
MKPDRQALGRAAEDAAVRHLEARGLQILLRNHRCRMGELDVIARESPDILVIAEVRLRSRRDYGGGAASVDGLKQRRIVQASRHLLMTRPALAKLRARFDVLDLEPAGEGYAIHWIRGAFSA